MDHRGEENDAQKNADPLHPHSFGPFMIPQTVLSKAYIRHSTDMEGKVIYTAGYGILMMEDAFLMHQARPNLIQNASDFNPSKGKIIISDQKKAMVLKIEVADHGSGIPAFALDKGYDKVYSLLCQMAVKKTGLVPNFK